MATVNNQDLVDLLTILYQGSVRRNTRAVPAVTNFNSALFFRIEDIELVANDYGYSLPPAGIEPTLAAGLTRGVFQRSIEKGTQCGASFCRPTTELPTLIYAYNPNMLTVNPRNQELIVGTASGTIYNYQKVNGTVVKFSNNRAPNYGSRGYAVWSQNCHATSSSSNFKSTTCCGK
jgi:hypothetical protein